MKTIQLEQYEMNDLIRFLEYAKNKKLKDYKKGTINLSQYNYELGLIRDLISKIPLKSGSKVTADELVKIM